LQDYYHCYHYHRDQSLKKERIFAGEEGRTVTIPHQPHGGSSREDYTTTVVSPCPAPLFFLVAPRFFPPSSGGVVVLVQVIRGEINSEGVGKE